MIDGTTADKPTSAEPTTSQPTTSQPTTRWDVEHRIAYPLIQEVALSPDGRHVAYTVREPLLTDEKSEFISQIYLAPTDGGAPAQLTFGEHGNSSPRWSPDGQYLAFLSKRSGKANVYALRAAGGEAWPLTRYEKTDVQSFRWSPDGQTIAFTMPEPPSQEKERAQKRRDDPLLWDVDFDFVHIWVVPFAVGPRAAAEARQITRDRLHAVGVNWLPDGRSLALTYQPTPLFDTWTLTKLATVALDGDGAPTDLALVADFGPEPLPSPDGRWIACGTSEQPARWGFAGRVVLYPTGGSTDGADARPLADTPDANPQPIGWSTDGSAVYALEQSGVSSQIWTLPITGEAGRTLGESSDLKSLPSTNGRDQVAFVAQDFDRPNAVWLLDAKSGAAREVTRPPLPEAWPEDPPRAEVIRWTAPDGLEIEGIVAYPLDYQPGQRYPLVVEVHGGPAGAYTRSYLGSATQGYADYASLAERGYVVLRANPRGSGGYGKEFRFANYGDWGGGDYRDILAGVDHLIERGIADPDRLGILGWSYGGFMTSWVITQTDRFKAACVGAGVTNLISFNGTSDIPSFLPDYFSAEFWGGLETYVKHSPVLQAKCVRTPTLIQHGDSDVRVPLGQGRELYNALKRQGTPVEMVVYPRQGHGIGEPRLLIDVQRRAVAWLDRWLGARSK